MAQARGAPYFRYTPSAPCPAARPMDLTSGAPFWIVNDGLLATYPRLTQDRRCDVAVIGGGISGALVAHRFVQEGIHVVLVEGREIGFGSTGATTALIQYEIDQHLCD